MISAAKFHGGAYEFTVAGNETLRVQLGRVWTLSVNSAGLALVLPRANLAPITKGKPILLLYNIGPADVDILDANAGFVVGIPVDFAAKIALVNSASTAGKWCAILRAVNG